MAAKLDVKGLGFAAGILYAAWLLVLGLFAMAGWGASWVSLLSDVYIGYDATVLGSLIGAVYGFVDGLICGAIFAWLYNYFK